MATPMINDRETVREERIYSTPVESEPTRLANRSPVMLHQRDVMLPLGPRVRWEGIIGGCVVAMGVLMLLVTLGLAVGFSTMDKLWQMNTETAKDLATGAGVWMTIALLTAYFVAGMVSTKVTDRPDRGGAVLHGTSTWVLLSLFLSWLLSGGMSNAGAGISIGPRVGMTPGGVITPLATLTDAELAHNLGLDDPTQMSTRLADPRIPLIVAAITGMSAGEAQTAVSDLQTRVADLQNDPAAVDAEVQSFVSRIGKRARANASQIAANVQRGAEIGSWTLFGIMSVTLLVSLMGALAGVPNRQRWQAALVRV